MNNKDIFDAIGDVPDELVEEAATAKLKRTIRPWQRWTAIAACAVLIIGIAAIIPRNGDEIGGAVLDVVFPKAYAYDDYESKHAIIENNPLDDTFLTAVNDFSYKTAAQILADNKGNANYSPLSLYYALALAASGASGKTADELLPLLGVSDQKTLSQQSGNLYRQLYSDNNIGRLKIANSLWMDESVSLKKDFNENAAENFYASSHSVDFANENAGKAMAQWVADNTNGSLSPEFTTNPEQILSILNTVDFYDQWTDRFDTAKTAADVFNLSDGSTVNCDFMNSEYSSAGFFKGEGFTRAGLNLKNASSMVFILPDEGVSPHELLSTPEKMKALFEDGEKAWGNVVWQIPKFSFGSKLDLVDTLKKLGISSAFASDADFSGITDQMAFISSIRQETHIAIDENGVEASAFTEILYCGGAMPEGRAEMILNRPFIYGITAPNGTLLFVGICENPTAK